MAKSTAALEAPSDESLDLAARAIAAITGCGIITALARADELPPGYCEKIAALERSEKRNQIPAVLNSVPPKTKANPESTAKKK